MRRAAADFGCLLLVIVGHAIALPLAAWRAWRGGVAPGSPAYRAALHWDLMIAALAGARIEYHADGSFTVETVSAWASRRRASRIACWLCELLAVRWPSHCDDAGGDVFLIRRAPRD